MRRRNLNQTYRARQSAQFARACVRPEKETLTAWIKRLWGMEV